MRVKSPKCGSLLYYCLAVACCCRVFDMMSVRCRPKDSWDILLRFEHSWPSHKPSSRMTLKMASDPFDLSISVSGGLHFLLLSPRGLQLSAPLVGWAKPQLPKHFGEFSMRMLPVTSSTFDLRFISVAAYLNTVCAGSSLADPTG